MADFRKLIYALALVALFIGVSTSANAQGMYCNSLTAVPELVRAEGLTELVGDIVLQCQASTPNVRTPAGQVIPSANVHVRILGTTITSRHVVSSTSPIVEPLLIVDEAGKQGSPVTTQTYCGQSGAPDNGPSSTGVCSIVAPVDGTKTYDGSTNTQATGSLAGAGDFTTCGSTVYGCGRPNIYQGQLNGTTEVIFPSVPMDPPGSNGLRTFRITNVRIDATKIDPASTTGAVAFVTIEGTASVALQNTTIPVAFTSAGMGKTVVTADRTFLQCVSQTSNGSHTELIRVTEGFRSSWKPRNVKQYVDGSNLGNLNSWLANASRFTYSTLVNPPNATDTAQNLPDYHYFTETGFQINPASGDTVHGIASVGKADYGTRIQFTVSAPPGGNSGLSIPAVAFLYNNLNADGSLPGTPNVTGVAVLTSVTGTGTGPFTAVTLATSGPHLGRYVIPATGAAVTYEVLFSDPGSIETLRVDGLLTYTSPADATSTNPALTDAAIGVVTQVGTATFAPYYASNSGSDKDGVPRFIQTTGGNSDFVVISKCSCSLLFPWVVGDSNYVTGFAISNTSMDPSNVTAASFTPVVGYNATQQAGTVTLYYFGRTGSNPVSSGTAAQTASAPSASVAAGSFATFLAPSGFAGYAIANAQFQYCHGVAFLFSTSGAVPPMSYLGLVMDHGSPLSRTVQVYSDQLVH